LKRVDRRLEAFSTSQRRPAADAPGEPRGGNRGKGRRREVKRLRKHKNLVSFRFPARLRPFHAGGALRGETRGLIEPSASARQR